MNSPEIERLVIAALHADAEDAMNQTNTTEQLQEFLEAGGRDLRDRRRLQAGVALAAVLVAIVVAFVVSRPGGDTGTAPPVAPPKPVEQTTDAEQVAAGFLEALATYDRPRAATYVAPGAGLTLGNIMGDTTRDDSWTLRNRWDEATGWKVTEIKGCHETGAPSAYVTVRCLFTAHQLGSDQLGRGPFRDNVLSVTLRDGAIVTTTLTTAHDTNGFADAMWDPFWEWMGRTHPNDEPRMGALEKPGASPARVSASLRLWHQRVQQYVDAVQAGTTR